MLSPPESLFLGLGLSTPDPLSRVRHPFILTQQHVRWKTSSDTYHYATFVLRLIFPSLFPIQPDLTHRIVFKTPLPLDVVDMNCDLKFRGVKRKLEQATNNTGGPLRKQVTRSGSAVNGTGTTSFDAKVSSTTSTLSLPSSSIAGSSSSPSPLSRDSFASTPSTPNATSFISINESRLSVSKIRQLVFNMSMCKLSRFRQTPDPSLVRSVLICNTLKRLERELDREGIRINFGPTGVSFIVPSTTISPSPHVSPTSLSLPSSPLPVTSEESKSFAVDGDSPASGRLTPFPSRSSDETDSALSNSDMENRRISCSSSSSNSSSDDSDSGLWSPEPIQRVTKVPWSENELSFESDEKEGESHPNDDKDCGTSSSPSFRELYPSTQSSLTNTSLPSSSTTRIASTTLIENEETATAVRSVLRVTNNTGNSEEIFGDIDLSLYDFDLLSPITTPNVKLTPVSAEELIRCISADNNSTEVSSSPSLSFEPNPSATLPSNEDISTDTVNNSSLPPISSSSTSSSSSEISATPCSSPSLTSSINASTVASSTSCASQSSTASVVFSKIFISKKDSIQYLDDIPTAIS